MLMLHPRWFRMVDMRGRAECWPWLGALNSKGYPCWSIRKRSVLAHRVAYMVTCGPIPEGLTIDHLCQNKRCVNPAHLEAVTGAENTARRFEHRTACKHGRRRVYRKGRLHYSDPCPDCDREQAAWAAKWREATDALLAQLRGER